MAPDSRAGTLSLDLFYLCLPGGALLVKWSPERKNGKVPANNLTARIIMAMKCFKFLRHSTIADRISKCNELGNVPGTFCVTLLPERIDKSDKAVVRRWIIRSIVHPRRPLMTLRFFFTNLEESQRTAAQLNQAGANRGQPL